MILEAFEEKNEIKWSFEETILLTQTAGGKETMKTAKATRTKRRTDKKRKVLQFGTMEIFWQISTHWSFFRKVRRETSEEEHLES